MRRFDQQVGRGCNCVYSNAQKYPIDIVQPIWFNLAASVLSTIWFLLLFLLWFKFDLVQNQVKLNIMFNVKFVLILIQTNYTKKIPQRRIILRRKKTTN